MKEETMCFTIYQECGLRHTPPDAPQKLQKLKGDGLRANSCQFQENLSKNLRTESFIPVKPFSYEVELG